MTCANFVEHYLHHQDKLKELGPVKLKFFWDQRQWHPVVRMRWIDSIQSNGEGVLTFPDGSKHCYNGAHEITGQPDRVRQPKTDIPKGS